MSVIKRASEIIREFAESLHDSHTLDGKWQEGDPTQGSYKEMLSVAEQLDATSIAGVEGAQAYEVRRGGNGEWGLFLRDFNLRLATFSPNSDACRQYIERLLATHSDKPCGSQLSGSDRSVSSFSQQMRKAFEATREVDDLLDDASYLELEDAYDNPEAQRAYVLFKAGVRFQRSLALNVGAPTSGEEEVRHIVMAEGLESHCTAMLRKAHGSRAIGDKVNEQVFTQCAEQAFKAADKRRSMSQWEWRPVGERTHEGRCEGQVVTLSDGPDRFYDDADIRCLKCGCTGYLFVDGEDGVDFVWYKPAKKDRNHD